MTTARKREGERGKEGRSETPRRMEREMTLKEGGSCPKFPVVAVVHSSKP